MGEDGELLCAAHGRILLRRGEHLEKAAPLRPITTGSHHQQSPLPVAAGVEYRHPVRLIETVFERCTLGGGSTEAFTALHKAAWESQP